MQRTARACGVRLRVTRRYRGDSEWLMSYGLGHPQRRVWTDAHLAQGGRLVGWDLGYWERERMMRVTIDADHPWRLVASMPDDRLAGISLRNDYDPGGHIVLVGLGDKTRRLIGGQWEQDALQRIQAAYPGREVRFKAKRRPPAAYPGAVIQGDVVEALRGASLVVCLHSNVAVDACIAGVPVVCADGIGRALYGNDLAAPVVPGVEERWRFLANVSYWQYGFDEGEKAWRHIQRHR